MTDNTTSKAERAYCETVCPAYRDRQECPLRETCHELQAFRANLMKHSSDGHI